MRSSVEFSVELAPGVAPPPPPPGPPPPTARLEHARTSLILAAQADAAAATVTGRSSGSRSFDSSSRATLRFLRSWAFGSGQLPNAPADGFKHPLECVAVGFQPAPLAQVDPQPTRPG